MAIQNFNEILKQREEQERKRLSGEKGEGAPMKLDDTQRVKVLSPGRLVAKRFWRNKLAIFGTAVLVFMFLFTYMGPLFYSYSQTETFYKYGELRVNYATVAVRTDYQNYAIPSGPDVNMRLGNTMTSYIKQMEAEGVSQLEVVDKDESLWYVDKLGDNVYTLSASMPELIGTLSEYQKLGVYHTSAGMTLTGAEPAPGFADAVATAARTRTPFMTFDGRTYLVKSDGGKNILFSIYDVSAGTYTGSGDEAFRQAALAALTTGVFQYEDVEYTVAAGDTAINIYGQESKIPALVSTTLVFDAYETGRKFSEAFKREALLAVYGSGEFTADDVSYTIAEEEDGIIIRTADGAETAELSNMVIRRYSGEDSMGLDIKDTIREVVDQMAETDTRVSTFTYALPQMDDSGVYLTDENGNLTYMDTEIDVTFKDGQYVLTCVQISHLIDIYAAPSGAHIFGTDSDGFDILARMMYGGRISLIVGFVVVILECFLGIIMGGIAGYFGKWVDTLVMRLVDIFYCIPSMPILIIMGALFDELNMGPYLRLVWMMAVLGFLGWASVARLVRGQILSLREQEFMTAAEATGISIPRRIFRHLLPNVMPQLIVQATMGLGSVIITESTLSFLGLGVKRPLATWGTMIQSITSANENLTRYAYIWIPVGMLICLTVIAFNFVGDGLRDAFDPKMKQ